MQFLEDVLQAGRKRHAIGYRERKAMGLSRAVVGVLSQDDDLHPVERREVEGIENQWAWWIDGILSLLTDEERLQVGEIRCLELRSQHLVPAFIDIGFLYFHLFLVVQLFS